MGGPNALEAMLRMQERVEGIVPVDTLHNAENTIDPKVLEGALKQLRADYKVAVTGLLNQFFFSPSTPPAVKNRIISETTARPPELAITILEAIFKYHPAPALRVMLGFTNAEVMLDALPEVMLGCTNAEGVR